MKFKKHFFFLFQLLTVNVAFAQSPLRSESILVAPSSFRYDYAFSFSGKIDNFYFVSASSPSSIVTETKKNDTINLNARVKYGYDKNVEFFLKPSFSYANNRSVVAGTQSNNTNTYGLDALSAGVNYQYEFKASNNKKTNSGIVLSLETTLLDRELNQATDKHVNFYLKNYNIGASIYKIVDPVVLTLSSGYQAKSTKKFNEYLRTSPNVFSISPSVTFAANPEVSLNAGLNWQVSGADKINGMKLNNWSTNSNVFFGVSYEMSKSTTLSVSARGLSTGKKESDFSVNFSVTPEK